MEINKEELINMMQEYWALDNNSTCLQATLIFCRDNDINPKEVGLDNYEDNT